ncbi:MAG: nucleotidyltransferase domain-containing protein [Victivallaceae bacterium]|nr:nucleotidyltransferase domain-containing protein [Victivallaceae bacterium]
MHDRIIDALRELERDHNCKILFAAESGSRAWGFASPDSDYDVRAIYVNPESWYWSLEDRRSETGEAMLPGNLDVSAWELRKTLRLFGGCNPSLDEWLGSPMVYLADAQFVEELRSLVPVYFNPIKTAHHYLAMSARALDDRAGDGTISVKKLFYALRGLLAAGWAATKEQMPPTLFDDLLGDGRLSADLLDEIARLRAVKMKSGEKERIAFPPALEKFFAAEREAVSQTIAGLRHVSASWEPLDRLFQKTVRFWLAQG